MCHTSWQEVAEIPGHPARRWALPERRGRNQKCLWGARLLGHLGRVCFAGWSRGCGYLQLAGGVFICNTDLRCCPAIHSSETTQMVVEGPSSPLAALQHSAAPIPSPPRVLRGCTAHNRDLRGCAVSWFQSRSATGCGRGGESARCSSRARPHRARCHYKQFNLELQLTVTSTEELLFFPHRKAAGMRARFQRLS